MKVKEIFLSEMIKNWIKHVAKGQCNGLVTSFDWLF
jgi:hypothetical protein